MLSVGRSKQQRKFLMPWMSEMLSCGMQCLEAIHRMDMPMKLYNCSGA
uniref:Uncharacterized protein n=1 Tax=Rhizophora mucronata TaxID=61149 RepID=A0A2P2PJ47_RHIMU